MSDLWETAKAKQDEVATLRAEVDRLKALLRLGAHREDGLRAERDEAVKAARSMSAKDDENCEAVYQAEKDRDEAAGLLEYWHGLAAPQHAVEICGACKFLAKLKRAGPDPGVAPTPREPGKAPERPATASGG